MLQAVSQNGKLVTPALLSKKVIAGIRGRPFYCPLCRERVILRAGEYVTPHFSHQKAATCIQEGGESDFHRKGKLQLYAWFQKQKIPVTLEAHLPEIKQRPDILVQINQRKIAIEFQCAKIDFNQIRQRNYGYQKLNIRPIWILGSNRLKRIGKNKIKIDTFTLQTLQQFTPSLPTQLIYYCPHSNYFSLITDLHMTSSHQALVRMAFKQADSTRFSELFSSATFPIKQLYKNWVYEKTKLRFRRMKLIGSEAVFWNWLYQKGVHLQQIPGIIYLPNPSQHRMRIPLWQWQSRFVIDFLHPMRIGQAFSLKDVHYFIRTFQLPANTYSYIQSYPDPGQVYLEQLQKLGILSIQSNNVMVKRRSIRFYDHIEEALKGDKAVMQRLCKMV